MTLPDVLSRVQAAHIASRELRFVDAGGRIIGTIPPYDLTNNQTGRDHELPRGALTTLLYDLTKARPIRYRFDDSIDTLNDDGSGVEIQFKSGDRHRYDVVIGADGVGLPHATARVRSGRAVQSPPGQLLQYLLCAERHGPVSRGHHLW
jgi:2-polyprenyl-6-methoxyphenol hydroxylase-like FAD-dependent oxidoreductase